jgi:hypothetical protein
MIAITTNNSISVNPNHAELSNLRPALDTGC